MEIVNCRGTNYFGFNLSTLRECDIMFQDGNTRRAKDACCIEHLRYSHEAMFPNQAAALDDVYRTLKRENYTSPDEMKNDLASLDRMKYREKWWVIDAGGGI